MEANLIDVKQVCELKRSNDLNRYLAAGWKLLSTVVRDSGVLGIQRNENITYIVGWDCEDQSPIHPDDPDRIELRRI